MIGATSTEWSHWAAVLGLADDLLPVVSHPGATISPGSKLRALGKTPSIYTHARQVAGIARWTERKITEADLRDWQTEPDYGICLRTASVRAIDIDLDSDHAEDVVAMATEYLGPLPMRYRVNSQKCLLLLDLPGDYGKRVVRTPEGAVEFLATGQQCVVAGTHPSGARYEWRRGLPDDIPAVSAERFEAFWGALEARYGTGTRSRASTRRETRLRASQDDAVAAAFFARGLLLSQDADGKMHVTCPWAQEHTGPSSESSTTYFPAHTGGHASGNFKCLHAHCEHRTMADVRALFFPESEDILADFELLPGESAADRQKEAVARFTPIPAAAYADASAGRWIVKGVLPEAELAVIFGASGSGKTFLVADLVAHIAAGAPDWHGHRITGQRSVVYIAAEGAAGFRRRLAAYGAQRHALDTLQLSVIADAPSLLEPKEVQALGTAIAAHVAATGPVQIIVVDTLAQSMPGGDENSGQDLGQVLAHCKALHRQFNALILLVHHSGKDASKGARGWSGLRAAADAEIEVVWPAQEGTGPEDAPGRVATITKQKDGAVGQRIGFQLLPVLLGTDPEGDEITSCVVEPLDIVPHRGRSTGGSRESGQVLDLVLGAIESLGGSPSVDQVIAEVSAQLPTDPEKRDRRRERVLKAVEHAQAKGRITVRDGRCGA